MPTIEISGPELSVPARRKVAVRLTRWLTGHGVPAGHVVVRFTEVPASTVFSGGMPVDVLPHSEHGLRYASVTVCVGPDRDENFRDALASEIAEALELHERTPFLYIEFRPTDPGHVYLAHQGTLRRAGEALATAQGKAQR
jgi:phenylpyruvate tautomerase PptA (4-oxalocrotonate tautomerase family)